MQQQVLSSHDALVATLDGKIVELERLCAGASSSVAGDSSASVKEASVGDAAEEEAFQENPISINLLQTLYSIRWRVLGPPFACCIYTSTPAHKLTQQKLAGQSASSS